MDRSCLIIMVRDPDSGDVKSRLAAGIGKDSARALYRCFGVDMISHMGRLDLDLKVGYHPPGSERSVRKWLGRDVPLVPQGGEDLGEKQGSLLETAFNMGYDRCALMISDGPDIPPALIMNGFKELDQNDCVIGPCRDGGYYMVGFNRSSYRPDLLSDMSWGHAEVAEVLTARLEGAGLSIGLTDPWWDVDNVNDLRSLYCRLKDRGLPSRTLNHLEEMILEKDLNW